MVSWLTHAFVAGALGKAQVSHVRTTRFWMWSIICSVLPDADVLGLFLGIRSSLRVDAHYSYLGRRYVDTQKADQ
jgi:hypothetical protein